MIVSDLNNWAQEKGWFSPAIGQALEWVGREIDADTPVGKYPIDGDRMYVLVQHLTTEPKEERAAEAHREYVDIQLLLSGGELIRVAIDSGNNEVWADERESRDRLVYRNVENESDIILSPGMFAVFFPSDIHRPCCSLGENSQIRKAVVKIHLSLL
jgi:biofilm protein TabA